MSEKLRAYLTLHFCVLIWGFTATLGKLINLAAIPLVWWRVLLCSLILLFIIPFKSISQITRAQWKSMVVIGVLIALHWICFYGAVKLSNASVAVATMATTAFFSALVEPLILKKKMRWYELALGLFVLPGMALVVGNIDVNMHLGFIVGIVCALLAAVFSTLNKKLIDHNPPPLLLMTWVELTAATIAISLFLPFFVVYFPDLPIMPKGNDWLWLLLLSAVCTILPFTLSLNAMRHISAFGTNLTLNLEPVYGIAFAVLFFQEQQELGSGFYPGVALILLSVLAHPWLVKVFKN